MEQPFIREEMLLGSDALQRLKAAHVAVFGIGGGSILMIWMTAVMAMDQRVAQGINLLYFLPTAATAMLFRAPRTGGGRGGTAWALPGWGEN